jgi:hypothetical protein
MYFRTMVYFKSACNPKSHGTVICQNYLWVPVLTGIGTDNIEIYGSFPGIGVGGDEDSNSVGGNLEIDLTPKSESELKKKKKESKKSSPKRSPKKKGTSFLHILWIVFYFSSCTRNSTCISSPTEHMLKHSDLSA